MTFYIDLDRTSHRTDRTDIIWRFCGRLFPVFDEDVARRYRDFMVTTEGDTYYYDLSTHLESVGLVPEEVYAKLLTTELADGRMQHDGLGELVATMKAKGTVKVLTYGPDRYQRFKAALCPALDGLEVLTTLEDKSIMLSDAGKESLLIDDKPVGARLPEGMHFIQVSLEGKEVPEGEGWPVFTSLNQVKEYIDETIH